MSVQFRSVTLKTEGIRPDEGAVLKTAHGNTLHGSSPWSSALMETVLWPSGEGNWFTPSRSTVRVRPGLLSDVTLVRLVRDMPAKHVWLSSNLNSVFFDMAHRSSMEWTLPCHGGDHRFESGMGRLERL